MTFIHTTHVGSLPRSPKLAAMLLERDHGVDIAEDAFDAMVSAELETIVRAQVEAGVSIVSDGELGKVGYSTYVTKRLSGFGGGHIERLLAKDLADLPELRGKLATIMGTQGFNRLACVGKVELVDPEPARNDIRRFGIALRKAGNGARGFMNAASPGLITAFQPNQFYPTHEAYLADLVTAMRPEYEAIVAAGFDLQLDAPDLAMAAHTGFQKLSEAEFLARAEQNIEALNAATAAIPPERMRMHICWGNYEGPHDYDIPLEKILSIVLKARPRQLLFEAANPRHEHEWIVWRDARLADDVVLVPGLIDTCSNYVEHPELVAQRIERFAGIVGADRVIAGTDCGFGTFAGYGKIDPAVTWKKLRALREGADIAGARL